MTWNPERRPNNKEKKHLVVVWPSLSEWLLLKTAVRERSYAGTRGALARKKKVRTPTPERLHDAVAVTQCYARLFARCLPVAFS